ncbi:MAG: hypothetical protein Q7U82_04345 [Gammaproteobacteria bacterium]|nr:hypothetical protein [Gammaproteobacteria bacterium]
MSADAKGLSNCGAGLQCSLVRPLQRPFLATTAQANGQENDQEQAHGGLTFW